MATHLKTSFKLFFVSEVTEQKLASPVPLTPSSPSIPEIDIQTVSFTVILVMHSMTFIINKQFIYALLKLIKLKFGFRPFRFSR